MDFPFVRFCRRLQRVAKLFRFVELCILLAFLAWLSTRLPFAVRISSEYCRRFSAIILSPISIFLLGNAIVVALLAKSGLFSGDTSPSIHNAVSKFYDQIRSEIPDETLPALEEDEVVYQDKEIICEENTQTKNSNAVDDDEDDDNRLSEMKVSYRRSQSEKVRRESTDEDKEKRKEKLRRSETDIRRRNFAAGDGESLEDDMSSEEFRRTIEAFIAKQARFHREERLAVVLHSQA